MSFPSDFFDTGGGVNSSGSNFIAVAAGDSAGGIGAGLVTGSVSEVFGVS